ncbi:pyrroline-5-carboxylate reductase [Aliikangiella marina]|uniref:Pyrroline-5-carboxylate reductase n=1 Tax=Aliikangiella marina TaxID=1712262 RepID=A0A545TA19_9GAMM|nr:pyrroline-5-carboxylate reductase [Aliikangiella marina]TQV74061.1 pyrroline-5-carboxylate reductase [Aliikangiella marina]
MTADTHPDLPAPNSEATIGFIGAGNMASAIIAGLISANWPAHKIYASNPSLPKLERLTQKFNIKTTQSNQALAEQVDILVLAVKPQKLADVCSQIKSVDLSHKLIISVAAGWPIQRIEQNLQQQLAVVRTMPNTPAFVGEGASGLFANSRVNQQQKRITETIFNAIGTTSWIAAEAQMDTVTAIAGSSPAYFFLMMESMITAAVQAGMSEKTAFELITQAMKGAATLAQSTPNKSLEQLRKEVTSPGGTTAAAIASFKSNEFEDIVRKAVDASIQRGKELGQLN